MTFEDTLATWLVKQRWFAGKGRTVHDLAVVADTEIIPGDPGLRHLLVTVSHGATSDCYQLFVGTCGSARRAACRSMTAFTTRT
jgi:maltokinase